MISSYKQLGSVGVIMLAMGWALPAHAAVYAPRAAVTPVVASGACEMFGYVRSGSEFVADALTPYAGSADVSALAFLNAPAADAREFYEKVVATQKALNFLQADLGRYMRTPAFARRTSSIVQLRFFRRYLQSDDLLVQAISLLADDLKSALGAKQTGLGQRYNVQPYNLKDPDAILATMQVLTRKLNPVLQAAGGGC